LLHNFAAKNWFNARLTDGLFGAANSALSGDGEVLKGFYYGIGQGAFGDLAAGAQANKMKADFLKLSELQANGDPKAASFESYIMRKYKVVLDYFTKEGDISVIGFRGWGSGKTYPQFEINGENSYDDLLVVLKDDRIYMFGDVNFEGSTAKGEFKVRGNWVSHDGINPSIASGTYSLNAVKHSGYYALALENGNEVPIREAINPNWPSRNPVYANGVHMHKGGRDWNWSVGCVTIYKDDWARYISIFPVEPIGTHVGTFYLLD
jgi:hypothetical protein